MRIFVAVLAFLCGVAVANAFWVPVPGRTALLVGALVCGIFTVVATHEEFD